MCCQHEFPKIEKKLGINIFAILRQLKQHEFNFLQATNTKTKWECDHLQASKNSKKNLIFYKLKKLEENWSFCERKLKNKVENV